MATLLEIRQMFSDDDFRNRVTSATVIAANNLLSGTPTEEQKTFAKSVFTDPTSLGRIVTMAVLAENSGFTVAQMQGAADNAIQNQVDAAILNLVGVA